MRGTPFFQDWGAHVSCLRCGTPDPSLLPCCCTGQGRGHGPLAGSRVLSAF